MKTFTAARPGSTRAAIVNYFLDLGKGNPATLSDVTWNVSIRTADATVRRVLSSLVAEGALRRSASGFFTSRSTRALNKIVA